MAATLAARLAARDLSRSPARCERSPESSIGLSLYAKHKGVRYYNDSKATNVDAT